MLYLPKQMFCARCSNATNQCNYFDLGPASDHNFHSCCQVFLQLAIVFRYDRNKLAITATGSPNWIEELEDDFEDMEEDIETYRCTCK